MDGSCLVVALGRDQRNGGCTSELSALEAAIAVSNADKSETSLPRWCDESRAGVTALGAQAQGCLGVLGKGVGDPAAAARQREDQLGRTGVEIQCEGQRC